jgi:hypothetical protein
MRLDDSAELVEIGIHASGLGIRDLNTCRCLLHTEAVGAVAGEIEPGQRRDFEAFFRAAMAPVPEAIQAIGLLSTFGDKASIDDQGLLMFKRDHLGDGSLIERHPVKGGVIPPGKGPLVIRTVATHIAEGGVSRKHKQESQ